MAISWDASAAAKGPFRERPGGISDCPGRHYHNKSVPTEMAMGFPYPAGPSWIYNTYPTPVP